MPIDSSRLARRYPVALVTGASSGIGQAIARHLLAAGITVYGTSRTPAAPGRDPALRWLPLDASTPTGVTSFIQAHANLLTKVDLLVNNAGSGLFGTLGATPSQALAEEQLLLLGGPVQLVRAVLPGMRERGRGAIVNISSLAAEFPLPYMAGYSGAKAGLSGFLQSLMLTERGRGIVLIDFQAGDYRTAYNANVRRFGEADAGMERAWRRMEANLAAAPGPERAAADVVRALERGRSAVVRSGGLFQRLLAPLGSRVLPRRVLLWAIRKYYRLP